jgi:hypothetical protein
MGIKLEVNFMPLVVNWAGTTLQTTPTQQYWSNKGGTFTAANGIKTYFPLPVAYRTAISAVGTYTVPKEYENRPDLIANVLYKSTDYWWLIYWFNGIVDPFSGPLVNDVLLIADINQVTSLLGP